VKNSSNSAPLTDLENKIERIMNDNAALHKELEDVKSSRGGLALGATAIGAAAVGGSRGIGDDKIETATAEEVVGGNNKSDAAETAKIAVKDALGHKIEAAKREDKDDLTVIKGVGNFIEQKLNSLGIFTYKQISQFDKELIEQVTTGIEFFPGRIERDDWVGQATRLLDIKKDDSTVLKKSIYPDNVEDLKIIEGIGPKLEKLLKDAGISNWGDLAKTDVKHLKEILIKGGDKYRIHDPSTWPMQAQMASDWKWTELKDYQDYLVGGGGEDLEP
jgi:predicted flap endonuclease-1-like 5' DNA nuclease